MPPAQFLIALHVTTERTDNKDDSIDDLQNLRDEIVAAVMEAEPSTIDAGGVEYTTRNWHIVAKIKGVSKSVS